MAQPARREVAAEEIPTIDPGAVDRAYRFHRAKRYARIERRRARRRARIRFWVVLVALGFAIVLLGLTVWQEIEKLFGL